MTDEKLNAIVEQVFEKIIERAKENGLEGDLTLIVSVASTFKTLWQIDLGIEPGSPEDNLITEKVNSRINEYNEQKSQTPHM